MRKYTLAAEPLSGDGFTLNSYQGSIDYSVSNKMVKNGYIRLSYQNNEIESEWEFSLKRIRENKNI